MERHEDGSVLLNPHEASEMRTVLDWVLRLYQAVGFRAAEMNYATALGLRGLIGEED